MRVRQQRALVELLRARRHVDGRVAREEVDGLEADFEDLAGHYGEVFDAWDLVERRVCQWVGVGIGGIEREGESEVRGGTGTYVVDAELDEDYEVGVDDGVFAGGPGADTGAAAGLVGVLEVSVS